jgi:hypothetical protein
VDFLAAQVPGSFRTLNWLQKNVAAPKHYLDSGPARQNWHIFFQAGDESNL